MDDHNYEFKYDHDNRNKHNYYNEHNNHNDHLDTNKHNFNKDIKHMHHTLSNRG